MGEKSKQFILGGGLVAINLSAYGRTVHSQALKLVLAFMLPLLERVIGHDLKGTLMSSRSL